MKIGIDNRNLETLEEMKKIIDEILDANFKDMDCTEENLKKAKEIIKKSTELNLVQAHFRVNIKIVDSDGTELTIG